jgi:hypothetical protein
MSVPANVLCVRTRVPVNVVWAGPPRLQTLQSCLAAPRCNAAFGSSLVRLKDCLFSRNYAADGAQLTVGGAIMIREDSEVRVAKTTFIGNSASGASLVFGGAMEIIGSAIAEEGVIFEGNYAVGMGTGGGAISVRESGAFAAYLAPQFRSNKVCTLPSAVLCDFGPISSLCSAIRFALLFCIQVSGSGPAGGAVYFASTKPAIFSGALFEFNAVEVRD